MDVENSKPSVPKIKHKSFTYRTSLEWIENRNGNLDSEGKPRIRISSPPEFKGEAGVWTPEDLFIATVNACTMTTFVAFAGRKKIPVISYNSEAEGLLEFVEGKYRITRVVVRPNVVVESADAVSQARETLEDAHDHCIITNSIRTTVAVEPEVRVR